MNLTTFSLSILIYNKSICVYIIFEWIKQHFNVALLFIVKVHLCLSSFMGIGWFNEDCLYFLGKSIYQVTELNYPNNATFDLLLLVMNFYRKRFINYMWLFIIIITFETNLFTASTSVVPKLLGVTTPCFHEPIPSGSMKKHYSVLI